MYKGAGGQAVTNTRGKPSREGREVRSVGGRREAIQSEVVLEDLHGDGPCGSVRVNIEGKKAVSSKTLRQAVLGA